MVSVTSSSMTTGVTTTRDIPGIPTPKISERGAYKYQRGSECGEGKENTGRWEDKMMFYCSRRER